MNWNGNKRREEQQGWVTGWWACLLTADWKRKEPSKGSLKGNLTADFKCARWNKRNTHRRKRTTEIRTKKLACKEMPIKYGKINLAMRNGAETVWNSFPRKQQNPSAFQKELDQFMKGTGRCRTRKSQEEDSMAQKNPLSPTFHTINSHNDGH